MVSRLAPCRVMPRGTPGTLFLLSGSIVVRRDRVYDDMY
jgi:hypothetical protein